MDRTPHEQMEALRKQLLATAEEKSAATLPGPTPPPPRDPTPEQLPKVYPGTPVPLAWKRIVQLRLENPQITSTEIARVLGVNKQSVMVWLKRYEYQQYENWALQNLPPEQQEILEVRKDAVHRVREKFETYLDDMQERLFTILETTESEKLQVEIIQDSFDRVGFQSQKNAPRATPILVTPEAMAEFMRRSVECGIVPPDAIDAEILSAPAAPLGASKAVTEGGRAQAAAVENKPQMTHLPQYLRQPEDLEESA